MTATELIHMLLTSTQSCICRHLLFQNAYFYNAVRLLCLFFFSFTEYQISPDQVQSSLHYIKYSPGLCCRPSVQRPYNIQVFASSTAVQLNVFLLQNSLKQQFSFLPRYKPIWPKSTSTFRGPWRSPIEIPLK